MNQNRKQIRRAAAEERMAACAKLSPAQRLAALDKAFGEGQGARKERARLQRMLSAPKDFLDEMISERASTNPEYPKLVEEAAARRAAVREAATETAPKKSSRSKSKKS